VQQKTNKFVNTSTIQSGLFKPDIFLSFELLPQNEVTIHDGQTAPQSEIVELMSEI
jgi:hypothetical protein